MLSRPDKVRKGNTPVFHSLACFSLSWMSGRLAVISVGVGAFVFLLRFWTPTFTLTAVFFIFLRLRAMLRPFQREGNTETDDKHSRWRMSRGRTSRREKGVRAEGERAYSARTIRAEPTQFCDASNLFLCKPLQSSAAREAGCVTECSVELNICLCSG